MISYDLLPALIGGCLVGSAVLRLVLWRYYSDGARILPKLRLAPRLDEPVKYYKRFDNHLAFASFAHNWLEIFAAVMFYRYSNYNPFAALLLLCVSAGRMRALQEAGHNALHLALCPSKRLQWTLSNILFQFPTVKRDMDSRFITHVKEHHPNADVPGRDPNLRRVIKAGMVPGISPLEFAVALLYPVTPKGIWESVRGNLSDAVYENSSSRIVLLRVVVTGAFVALFLLLGGWQGWLVGHVVPVFTIYPLFAWWSLLSKHRWHTDYDPSLDRRGHDYEHGRATDFRGLFGAIQRYLFFPTSDAYHLAHHIYPYVRSEYMPVIDRQLKIQEPRYTQYISRGMLIGRSGQPAALSELFNRLVYQPVENHSLAS